MSLHRLLVVSLLLSLASCLAPRETVPETGRQRPRLQHTEQEMAELGAQAYEEVLTKYKVIDSGPQADLVNAVGQKLAATTGKSAADGYDWEFKLLDAPDTINAFCLPGGKVAVFSGILPITANDQGLSVVLSHEIAHATLQHSNERMSQSSLKTLIGMPVGAVVNVWGTIAPGTRKAVMDGLGLGAVFGKALPWDQEQESEADAVGLKYMQQAGYDIDEAPKFWKRMQSATPPGQVSDSLSTHPSSAKREADLEREIQRMKAERA